MDKARVHIPFLVKSHVVGTAEIHRGTITGVDAATGHPLATWEDGNPGVQADFGSGWIFLHGDADAGEWRRLIEAYNEAWAAGTGKSENDQAGARLWKFEAKYFIGDIADDARWAAACADPSRRINPEPASFEQAGDRLRSQAGYLHGSSRPCWPAARVLAVLDEAYADFRKLAAEAYETARGPETASKPPEPAATR